eukprot:1138171-Pelagomonas_calceolata.AAC.11
MPLIVNLPLSCFVAAQLLPTRQDQFNAGDAPFPHVIPRQLSRPAQGPHAKNQGQIHVVADAENQGQTHVTGICFCQVLLDIVVVARAPALLRAASTGCWLRFAMPNETAEALPCQMNLLRPHNAQQTSNVDVNTEGPRRVKGTAQPSATANANILGREWKCMRSRSYAQATQVG